MQQTPNLFSTLVPIIIIFAVVALRARKMAAVQPMRLDRIWIRPAIVMALTGYLIYYTPPAGLVQIAILLSVFGVGAMAGWHQAKLMEISVDATSGTLQVKASILALIVFFGIIALRIGLRPWLMASTSPLHNYVGMVTDSFLVFIVGFYAARSIEMYVRGRALLAAAPTQTDQSIERSTSVPD
jgi:hypothetical protein